MPAADIAQRRGSTQVLGRVTQRCKTSPGALAPSGLRDTPLQCQPQRVQGEQGCRDAQTLCPRTHLFLSLPPKRIETAKEESRGRNFLLESDKTEFKSSSCLFLVL